MIAYIPAGRLHARNVWLRTVLAVGMVALAPQLPWLSLILLWFFLYWKGANELGPLVVWVTIGATWVLVRAIPREILAVLLVSGGLFEASGVLLRWLHGHRRPWGVFNPAASGHMLALTFPFTLVAWPLSLAVSGGLWLTHSYLAFIALACGLIVYLGWWPLLLVAVVAVLMLSSRIRLGLDRWTPRGSSPDWRSRIIVWQFMAANLTWRGHGHGTLEPSIAAYGALLRRNLDVGPACCEPLQVLWEYGALGGLAMLAFLGPVVASLRWDDPWSASFVIGCIASCGYFPFRYAPIGVAWLAVAAHL